MTGHSHRGYVTAIESRGSEWESMIDQMQDWIDPREKTITSLEAKVTVLESRLNDLGRKYRHALDHIRVLRHGHPDPPALPESIAEDV